MGRAVTVRVPASSANLGPGFDSLGIALNMTGDVTITLHDRPAPHVQGRSEQLALTAARALFMHAGKSPSSQLQAQIDSDIPVGRGLGASAVLRVGAVVAANRLLDDRFEPDQIAVICAHLEGHADNVAPALFGGMQAVVWDEGELTRVTVPLPAALEAILLIPVLDMPTSESRRLLPVEFTRREVVHNIGRAALLVAAMAAGRLDALRVATQDVVHQPARSRLFPALYDVIAAAEAAGAHCAYLSGGGSAVLAFTSGGSTAAVGEAMLAAAQRRGTQASYVATRPRADGAEVVADRQTP